MEAPQVIEKLREMFVYDNFQFSFNASVYLAGDDKKTLRQNIIELTTGKKLPKNKCTLTAASDAISNSIKQPTLF